MICSVEVIFIPSIITNLNKNIVIQSFLPYLGSTS